MTALVKKISNITNGWTVNTLHEHIIQLIDAKEERDSERFKAQREMTALALSSADKAISKAEAFTEKRFDNTNEWRKTFDDKEKASLEKEKFLMPRLEAELILKNLSERIKSLEDNRVSKVGVGQGLNLGWVIVISVIGLIGSLLGIAAYLLSSIK